VDRHAALRVLVVAGSPLARAGLAGLLSDQPDLLLLGQVSDDQLPEALDLYQPEALVWDLGYEPLAQLERIQSARAAGMLTLALAGETWHATEAAPALIAAGAQGLMTQAATGEGLAAALHALAAGLLVLDAGVGEAVLAQEAERSTPAQAGAGAETFTPREREVLALVAEGLPNKAIARRLQISEHTVKFHLNAVLSKLGAQSRTDAVVRATRLGLLAL
jgi:DNA-binding NarL/FixJ family response regulator